ncbi:hypothetical protein BH23GEM9_BH23GEM9_30060 [soil metagenome]
MRRLCGVVVVALVTSACAADEEQRIEPVGDVVQQPTAVALEAPDTTAEALWAHLQDADYRSWPMFPGTGELYSGTEPHGMLLTTYVNRIASDALTNGASALPAGAIIVKENYMPDSTFAAATVMHKVPGYDAGNGDWYWAKYDPNGVVEDAGRAPMCQQCHAAQRQRDFVMTPLPGN